MKPGFRVEGLPIWVTYLTGLLAVFSTVLGIMGLIDPTTVMGYSAGAEHLASGWAGRNAGIGLAMAVAFFLRNPAAYAAVYVAAVCREVGDSFSLSSANVAGVVVLGVFLLWDVIALVLSFRAALGARARERAT